MKKIWTILFTLMALTSFGQQIKISEELTVRNDDFYEIIGQVDTCLLLFRDKADQSKVLAFNADMEKVWEKKVQLENKRSRVLYIASTRTDFTVIYRFYKRGKIFLQARKFSPAADTIQTVTIRSFAPRSTNYLDIIRSNDKTKLLIFDTDLGAKIYATAFDLTTMSTLWNKNFMPTDFSFERDFVQGLIDNQANAYFMLQRDNKKPKRNTSRFEVLHFDGTAKKERRFSVSMKGKLWLDARFDFDNKNQLLVGAGLFSTRRYGETNGFFYLRLDPGRPEAHTLKFNTFDPKFVTTILGKEVKKDVGFGEVNVRELILRSDGGLLMVAERNKKYTRRATSYNSFYNPDYAVGFQIDYHYNDLLLISANPDGSVHWKELLRKRQFSQDDQARYSSYFLIKARNSLRFLYNDEIKLDTNVNEYLVLGDGQNKRKNLFSTKEDDLYLMFQDGIQISSNEAIVPSERRGDLKLVRISY